MKAANGFTHKSYDEMVERFNELCGHDMDWDNDELVKIAAFIFSIEAMSICDPQSTEEKARHILAKRMHSHFEVRDKKAFVSFPSPFFEADDIPNKIRERDIAMAIDVENMVHEGMNVLEAFDRAASKHNLGTSSARSAYYKYKSQSES